MLYFSSALTHSCVLPLLTRTRGKNLWRRRIQPPPPGGLSLPPPPFLAGTERGVIVRVRAETMHGAALRVPWTDRACAAFLPPLVFLLMWPRNGDPSEEMENYIVQSRAFSYYY